MSILNRRKRACKLGVNRVTGSCLKNKRRRPLRGHKRRSVACRLGKVRSGPRAGKCRKVRVAPCKLYAAYRRTDGKSQWSCAARSTKQLAKKAAGQGWPSSWLGPRSLRSPTEFRHMRAIKRQMQKDMRKTTKGAKGAKSGAARYVARPWPFTG